MALPLTSHEETLTILESYIDRLGAPVLPIWGIGDDGVCLCPKAKECLAPGKHPLSRLVPNGVTNATLQKSVVKQWLRAYPNANWAIRCGGPIPGTKKFLGGFDVDPRNGGFDTLAEITRTHGDMPESVSEVTGGGGSHSMLGFSKSPSSRTVGPGIDLQGAMKYLVVAPSRHKSGAYYEFELGHAPGDIDVADAPGWLDSETGEAVPRPDRDAGGSARETVLGEAFALANRAGAVMPDGTMFVNCVQSAQHGDARGRGEDSSSVILPPAGGSRFGGYRCFHSSCVNLKWDDVLRLLPKEAVGAAQRKYPRLNAVPEPAIQPVDPREAIVEGGGGDPLKAVRRLLEFLPSGKGFKIKSDIVNLVTILTHDPRWQGILRWDEFSQILRFTRPPPWHPEDAGKEVSSVWTDEDTTRLDAWLRRNWAFEAKSGAVREVVYMVGRRDAINPLRDWLDALTWDGTPRLNTWLTQYLGSVDTPYVRAVARKWMISAVARAFKPGSKADHMMVLEGPQGKGKSTALRALASDQFFSDTPVDIGSKDAYLALRGTWLMEIAELASLSKADSDRTKAFLSSPTDQYRPPYGRETITVPRTTVFCGSVNLGTYLKDSTGGRRFWPIVVGAIDVDGLLADRDQLWAETVVAYKNGETWWPSFEEVPLFEEQQEAREVSDVWEDTIVSFLASSKSADMLARAGYITTAQIAVQALGFRITDVSNSEQQRISNIVQGRMKWERVRGRIGVNRVWGYKPPSK